MLADVPVLILAGGLGTRLRPVLSGTPKGLARIGDRPFLDVQIELLRDQGARRFVLCVGHLAGQIRDAYGDGSRLGVRIDYSVEEGPLLGTGGALRHAEAFFQPRALVLNGDTYLAIDYESLVRRHADREPPYPDATLALARAEGNRFGTVLLDPAGERLVGFREKEEAQPSAGPRWLNAGAYVIERPLLSFVPPGEPASLERLVFPAALAAGRVIAAATFAEPFYDIGTPDDWQRFAQFYLGRRAA